MCCYGPNSICRQTLLELFQQWKLCAKYCKSAKYVRHFPNETVGDGSPHGWQIFTKHGVNDVSTTCGVLVVVSVVIVWGLRSVDMMFLSCLGPRHNNGQIFWHSLDQKAVVQGSQYNGIHTARCLRGALPLCLTRSSQKWMHDSWNIAFAGLVCVSLFLDGVAQWRFGECSSKLTNTSRGLGWDSLLPRPLVTCCGSVSSSFAYAFESVLAHRGCGTEGWVLNLISRMVRTVVPAKVWSISSTLWGRSSTNTYGHVLHLGVTGIMLPGTTRESLVFRQSCKNTSCPVGWMLLISVMSSLL